MGSGIWPATLVPCAAHAPSTCAGRLLFMRSGGQTTVIQRILEKRAQKPPQIQEDTSATIAVMLRVLPPPRAMLVFEDAALREHCESAVAENVLDIEAVDNELE